MKTIIKEIEDNEVLVAFALPEADAPELINAICKNNGYSEEIPNPDYLVNKPVSETNKPFIANPMDQKAFTLTWVAKMAYAQMANYRNEQSRLQYEKEQQALREANTVNAKIV